MSFSINICIFVMLSSANGYNLDTTFAIVYESSPGDYFGYTVALHKNKEGPLALVGAPRSNTTTFSEPMYQPGTLFKCSITGNKSQQCREIPLIKAGTIEVHTDYEDVHQDKKDGMWLGVSLTVRPSVNETDIVTCGHLWKSQYYNRIPLVKGMCYVINGDLEERSVKKLLPLTKRAMQYGKYMENTSEYIYTHGHVGISAAFSEDGSNLIIGAPGACSFKGSVVHYPGYSGDKKDFYSHPDITIPTSEINFSAYYGYSVGTGYFLKTRNSDSKIQFYAVGAPRDGVDYGRVYIVRIVKGLQNVRLRKQGIQMGEYFGGSVLGINLNNDSYTDLLVGAPLHSLKSGGDEGIVYVYISNGNDLLKDIELKGGSKHGARFGMALANIGDLNQDGFIDFAVGAPYEDGTGAVYIYHSSRTGVNPKYAQKIQASAIKSTLSGFGIHISHGVDIDGNGYPDILIGSYASSNAVLLRSHPVIRVSSEIIFTPKQISPNYTCDVKGQNVSCFQMEGCVWYTGTFHINTVMAFALGFGVDSGRANFFTRERRVSRSRVKRSKGKTCAKKWIYLNPGIEDYTPLEVLFLHKLVSPQASGEDFNMALPMYHPSSRTSITSHIAFKNSCGDDHECYSDLNVSVTREELTKNGMIILGKISTVPVVITVTNHGDPAFLSELHIYLPAEMPIINQGICEAGDTKHNTNASLVCKLGNPLQNGSQVVIHIKLDATKIPLHTRYLEIVCEAVTLSNDANPDNNVKTLPIHLERVTDISVTGISTQDQILYEEIEESSPIVTHTYVVRNYGPSPVEEINILLQVPYVFLTSNGESPFVYWTGLDVESETLRSVHTVCENTSLYIKNAESSISINDETLLTGDSENPSLSPSIPTSQNLIGPSSDATKISDENPTVFEMKAGKENVTNSSNISGHVVIDCASKNVNCITLRCFASPFSNPEMFSQLYISLQLNFSILNEQIGQWNQIEFVTSGSISISNKEVIDLQDHPKSVHVKTVVFGKRLKPPRVVAVWTVFVGIGVGIILLLIIVILLIKIGFFNRREKSRLKEMMLEVQKEENFADEDANDNAGVMELLCLIK